MSTPLPSILHRYWRAYGGLAALVRSGYLHAAVLLTVLTWHTWGGPHWWDTVISVLPNLLGFTLGGFAIFIGFGDDSFRRSLAAPEDDPATPSVYFEMCATFVHFILVQVIGLVLALVAKGLWFHAEWMAPLHALLPTLNAIGGAAGYLVFLYAITSIVAVTLHVLRIASMYEQHQRHSV